MANTYDQPSISGYNSGAPPDDGSQTAANEITWAGIKTKLADPIKDYVDAINQEVVDSFNEIFPVGITSASTNYTVQAGDNGKLINATNTITITLLAAATAGVGFLVWIRNNGSGTVTVDGNASETINGSTSIEISPGGCVLLTTNGSNWSGMDVPSLNSENVFLEDQTLRSSDAGATVGPTFTLHRDSASPAASDVLGSVDYDGEDSGGTQTTYARTQGEIVDPTDTSEDGKLSVQTVVAGTLATRAYVAQGVVVGSPTDGDKGTGTVNATAYYINGSQAWVDQTYIASSAVGQGELKTTTGTVSNGGAGANVTLPGGEYGFYPQTRLSAGATSYDAVIATDATNTSFATNIWLQGDSGNTGAAQQRYVQSSPPYEPYRVGDSVPIFVFAKVDKTTGEVVSTYVAEDPPWANNGPTLINPLARIQALAKLRVSGETFEEQMESWADFDLWLHDPANNDLIRQELARKLSQEEKNRDMALIPHPFPDFDPLNHVITVLAPSDCRFCRGIRARHLYGGDSITELLHRGYIHIDNSPLDGFKTPANVLAVSAKFKNAK